MAVAVPILMAAGAAVSIYGTLRQGQQNQQTDQFNADLAFHNAQLARDQATQDEMRYRIAASKQIGHTEASIGASGITGEGSGMDILRESVRNSELDAQAIHRQGEQKYQSYINQSTGYQMQGSAAGTQALLSASGTLLSGGAKAASALPSGTPDTPGGGSSYTSSYRASNPAMGTS